MTIHELYDYIIENYGKRKCWISDLATTLNISREDANYLTYFLGYRRGKEGLINTRPMCICFTVLPACFITC